MCLSCCSFIVCLCAVLFLRYTKILIELALLSRTAWCNIVTPSFHNSCVRFPYSFKTSTDEFVLDNNRLKPLSPDNFFQYYILYRRIKAAEMKLLRHLAGYNLHDHKTNHFILRELKIVYILDKIHEYRLNWPLHLQRMPQNRITLESYHYRTQGRRTIGRPKNCWREQL